LVGKVGDKICQGKMQHGSRSTIVNQWFEKATSQENAEVQFELELLYRNGRGVDQNLSKAFELYQLAADNNHSMAKNYLGGMLDDGIGVK